MNQKSKPVAYVLWFFFGLIGFHKFYLGKVGVGILYLFTLGLAGIGWIIDLFTLGTQVDVYNALHRPGGQSQQQNVVVNVQASAGPSQDTQTSPEKQILDLAKTNSMLTLKDIISGTSLSLSMAEQTISKLVEKGLAKKIVADDGRTSYDLS